MVALIVGLGSMGRRRIRNLRMIDSEIRIIGVDRSAERRRDVSEKQGIETFNSVEEAVAIGVHIDMAFVSTPPSTHGGIVVGLLERGINVFSEINLVNDMYDEIKRKSSLESCVAFLSSTMLYRSEIKSIIKLVHECESPMHYRYHVGQYLPDWHPWESYKDFFVFDPKTNGCREIAGIELPWLVRCFGRISNYTVTSSSLSDLGLEYPDSYILVLEHENGCKGTFCIDVVSRFATREMEIYSESLHVRWSGRPDTLMTYDVEKKEFRHSLAKERYSSDERYAANIIEDAYVDEVHDFISEIKTGQRKIQFTYDDDSYIIEMMNRLNL